MMDKLTPKIVLELAVHEGMTLEAFLDRVAQPPVWTWAMGVTNASGHNVERYIRQPTDLSRALEVSLWLIENKYLPRVLKAFKGYPLKEHELAAALSFDWNTGAIHSATWVKQVKAGEMAKARKSIMNWKKPASLIPRRRKERDLFFDGKWHQDGTILVYDVVNTQPVRPKKVNIKAQVENLLGASQAPKTEVKAPKAASSPAGLIIFAIIAAVLAALGITL